MQTQPTDFSDLSHGLISPQPGFNPRRHIDQGALDHLAETIRQQGVIQPIRVRPRHDGVDGYWIVCGERRWRAAGIAGLEVIPSIVRDYDDATALAVANLENQERENLSPAEEAHIARRAVGAAGGDVEEAGRILNWATSRVQARLLLLHACDEVQTALSAKTIRIGHAELMSTLPPDVQKRVLANVIKNKATVEELRTQLASFTQELSAAPFPTDGCQGCPNNSSVQASLFEFSVGAGRCSNKVCWDGKRTAALDEKKAQASTEYNLVFFDREKDSATYTRLEALGPRGVGEDQLQSGCKSCRSYGAIVTTVPGKEGKVLGGQCFDLGCHSGKVEEYQATLPPPPKDEKPSAPTARKAKAAKPVKKVKPKGKVASSGSPAKVLREIWQFFQREGVKEAEQSPRLIQAVALYALMKADGKAPEAKGAFKKILALNDADIATQIRETALHIIKDESNGSNHAPTSWEAVGALMMKDRGVELAGRFKLEKAFVAAHTKSGLEALLTDAGFAESLEGKTPDAKKKAFKKLLGQKTPEIVSAVMKSKHDFSTFVPKDVTTQFKKI